LLGKGDPCYPNSFAQKHKGPSVGAGGGWETCSQSFKPAGVR